MTISVKSQYLYHVIEKLSSEKHNDFLRIIFLIEAVDYHKRNLDAAQKLEVTSGGWQRGTLQPPEDWKTSLGNISSEEKAHYWSFMVSIIELEAFLSAIVRLSDVSYSLLNKQMIDAALSLGRIKPNEAGWVGNIRGYCENKKKEKFKFLQNNPYNQILEDSWKDWLEYTTNLRNLVTHTVPLGGRTWSSCTVPCDGQVFSALIIPKEFEIKKKDLDIDKIFCLNGFPDEMQEVFTETNSKIYSDKIHKKAHELVEKLLIEAQ
ncbi:MAG: hypothetical protein H6859_11035 [Rhodospirillales bacterium]|nr:hypothetical protein [Alphaproteobacteria bacterium]USO05628.1 MAG: hypothetical protein H6859_11035 [Rhodospirillales bacterium]